MGVELNHTIVWCRDKEKSAAFLTRLFGLPPARRLEPFLIVDLANGVSIDFHSVDHEVAMQHYAFLVGEDDFDAIFTRIREQGFPYWADPARTRPGEINHNDGGRGCYFEDPDRHFLEILTRPCVAGE